MARPLSVAENLQPTSHIDNSLQFLNQKLLGKEPINRLALACILARGHLLIEDVPGVGKTTLARALSEIFGLQMTRIQFTNDLLPADVVGGSVFNSQTNSFAVKKGPLFSEFVLADELNRGSPRTQSAVLEAMEEKRVTIDGTTFALPNPFVFVATQNPIFQSGTNPLPESQLDRFLMMIHLGFPDAAAERKLLRRTPESMEKLPAHIMGKDALLAAQAHVDAVHLSDTILDYIQEIIRKTRSKDYLGVSPRGALALAQAAKAIAYTHAREFVIPEDVQEVAIPVLSHRWIRGDQEVIPSHEKVREILAQVSIP